MIVTRNRDVVSFKTSNGERSCDLRFDVEASINSDESNSIDISFQTASGRENIFFSLPYQHISFNGTTQAGSSVSDTVSALNQKFLFNEAPVYTGSSYNIDDFIKPDLTSGKSETTDIVHNESIANGGAMILSSESAKIGVQGNHIEFNSTGTYGDIDINVKTPSGNTDRAIHIFGTDIQQGPVIEFEGRIIISASNGNRYYLKVSNTGGLYTEAV